ncbi:hypothetical protein KAH43_07990 [Candidatus Bipolaricaulota bacterium]|nr:hypothetical protein [Candidatus Bipolaricaulota bacterium]
MDRREIELIDFLRILWWGKWIILACLAVGTGLALLYTTTHDTTYSGSTRYLIHEYVSAAFDGYHDEAVIAFDNALALALADLPSKSPGVTASFVKGQLVMTHNNAVSSADVNRALNQADETFRNQLQNRLAEELVHVSVKGALQEASHRRQIEILKLGMGQESSSQDAPISVALANLHTSLAQDQVYIELIASIDPATLFEIRPVGQPVVTASSRDPLATLLVAAFVALFFGAVLTLFVHYLIETRTQRTKA